MSTSSRAMKRARKYLKGKIKKQANEDDKTRAMHLAFPFEKAPSHLTGKDKGLWYRDRSRAKKLIMNAEAQTSNSRQVIQQKGADADNQLYFTVQFQPHQETLIKKYLNMVTNTVPTFLIPLTKYHDKMELCIRSKYINSTNDTNFLRSNYNSDQDKNKNIDEDHNSVLDVRNNGEIESSECDTTRFLIDIKKCDNIFPFSSLEELSFSHIEDYLKNTPMTNPYNNFDAKACSIYPDLCDDDDCFASVDKYKHLEESPFKTKFFNILTQNIQMRLKDAVKSGGLKRDDLFDLQIFNDFNNKLRSPMYRNMLNFREKLPAYNMKDQILDLVKSNQVVLITGETGCGKTTQVAQFILDEAIIEKRSSLCNVLCTQPRRISAVSVSQRVADERDEKLGVGSVGYQIRLERKIGRHRGSIVFCTTGILLQYMQGDPALKKFSHIVLDEIHERDTLCDFSLTILRDLISLRKDLKIILMSATLNSEQFSKYFCDCPSINIPGYTYPVEEFYLEDVLNFLNFKFPVSKKKSDDYNFNDLVVPYAESLKKVGTYQAHVIESLKNPDSEKINADLVLELIKYICTKYGNGPGAILVFVPGWEDITAVMKALNNNIFFTPQNSVIIPLHSMLSNANQKMVFDRPPFGKRKIIIATNIAETSITIDDVVFVIDCGKIKIKNYDNGNNISTLRPEFISRANARQRKGRAGRVQKGYCYHLFSKGRERGLQDYPIPEIMRTRLEEVILSIKLLMLGKAAPFLERVMDPPDPATVKLSLELLQQLNAIDENENLTPLGFHLAKLPLDPRIGKMILIGSIMSCLDPILSIAACLSFKDPFYMPMGDEQYVREKKLRFDTNFKSDHLLLVEAMRQWEAAETKRDGLNFCSKNFLTRSTMFQLKDLKKQYAQYLSEMGFLKDNNFRRSEFNQNSDKIAILKSVICAGMYPNLALIKKKVKNGLLLKTLEDSGTVRLHPKSVNAFQTSEFESKFVMYHEKLKSSCIFIYDSTMISPLPVLIFSSDFFITKPGKNKIDILLNNDLKFRVSTTEFNYIIELKIRLNWLLEYKLCHPERLREEDSSEKALLSLLIELFTQDDETIMKGSSNSTQQSQ